MSSRFPAKLPTKPIAAASLSNIYFTGGAAFVCAKKSAASLRVVLYCRKLANSVCRNRF